MCTALPPSNSPLITNTAATVHNRLRPTVRPAARPTFSACPGLERLRGVPRRSFVRLRPERCMTFPPGPRWSRVLVRGGVVLPRPRLELRRRGRSALPPLPSFLLCAILVPILRFASRFVSVDPQGVAFRLTHAELASELPDP